MSERGVFAVDRGIWDDPDFADQEFTEREAMMWLIGAAAWTDRTVRGAAGPVNLARGEFCFSVRFLAEKWKWSKSRVDRFLNKLEKRDTLRASERDNAKVYSIKNYNRFQVVGLPRRDSKRDTKGDASGTAAGQQRDKEETLEHSNIERQNSRGQPGPIKAAFDAYNHAAPKLGIPVAKSLSADRQGKLAARLREHGLDGWRQALVELAHAPFLLGQNERGWRADLDFLLTPAKLNRLLEGGYRSTAPPAKKGYRRNGDGWYVEPGTEPFEAHKQLEHRRGPTAKYFDFVAAEKSGEEVKVDTLWPSRDGGG